MATGIVYSTTGVTSADGAVSTNHHTDAIYFYNTDVNTNATIKLNGGPHTVLIPHAVHGGGYTQVIGDFTKFEILTANVTLAVYAIG